MWIANQWKDYELIDAAGGEKLERWGSIILRRPDPLAVWEDMGAQNALWQNPHATYHRSNKGGGHWEYNKKIPDRWTISYRNLTFNLKPMGFKHTGLFPEQAVNWDWFTPLIQNASRKIRVLNLFAYTGGATVAAAAAGADVVHIDAAKGMVTWAKENIISSHLEDRYVRFMVDDCMKFVKREQRRGNQYDAIIMDPPSYGRGPGGEVWKIEQELWPLVTECVSLLSDTPLFFLINSYTAGLSATVLYNVLTKTVAARYGGVVTADEIGLPMSSNSLALPCGISGRWQFE